MDKKNIKRIIAREGLIFIAIAVTLYCLFLTLYLLKFNFTPPVYKLELADGTVRYLPIDPDIKDNMSPNEALRALYNPLPSLVLKRLEEFSKTNNTRVLSAHEHASWKGYISEKIAIFAMLGRYLQIVFIYLFALLIRFIIWAIKMLRREER